MKVLAEIAKGVTIEVEMEDGKEALLKAIDLANKWCNECKEVKDDFRLYARTYDDIAYVKRICLDCGCASNLGSHKVGGTYFWKRFERYDPDEKKIPGDNLPINKTEHQADLVPQPTEEPEDLPF